MNLKEWAEKLNNIEYPCDDIREYRNQLSEDGVVAVYGSSDDLMEMDGAVYDEYDCYSSKIFYWFGKWFVSNDHIEDFIESVRYDDDHRVFADIVEDAFKDIDAKKSYIKVNTETSDAQFEYETNIPCEWFNVIEDGNLYCKGFVFNRSDLR